MNAPLLDAVSAETLIDSEQLQRTGQLLETSPEDSQESEVELDLAHLRDLLGLLSEFRVAGFSAGGISVTFKAEDEPTVPLLGRTRTEAIRDEDASTSSRPIAGFSESKDGWRNPNLWPSQAGRVLKFDGSLE